MYEITGHEILNEEFDKISMIRDNNKFLLEMR